MPSSSLIALLDDIATVLDDVAAMTKVASQKTAGVLGDDLALNAQQVAGVRADRELPVVWAVAKGSFKNKLILVPLALALSYFAPFLIVPLLMVGGAYLCFEGFEKIAHHFLHTDEEDAQHEKEIEYVVEHEEIDLVEFEKEKIQGAIRTDFVLSGEIIIIALGVVSQYNFITQVGALALVSILMTVGVYGFVGIIVKLDDMGLYLQRTAKGILGGFKRVLGKALLSFAPLLMKSLAYIGTLAMFLVGGGIMSHHIHALHEWTKMASANIQANLGTTMLANAINATFPSVVDIVIGVVVGGLTLLAWKICSSIRHQVQNKIKKPA